MDTTKTKPAPALVRAPEDAASFNGILDRLNKREDIFGHIGQAELAELMRCGTKKAYRNGDTIFSQGAGHDYAYFVLRGVVRSSYVAHNSKEYTVAYWSKGDLVGGPYFMDDKSIYLWSGHAVEPTEVLAISGGALRNLCFKAPALAVAMIDALSFKIHWFSLLLQIMGTQTVEGRLGILLLGLGSAYGVETQDGLLIRYTFTQTDLARMIGVSRQWVNNALGHLQKKGAITIVKGRFLIKDRKFLKESLGPGD